VKVKTINLVLQKKFNEWKESITDKTVRDLVENNTIITGGCIASMLLREKVNDYDLYFTNRETTLAVAKYYVNKFNGKETNSITSIHGAANVKIAVDESLPDRITTYVKSAGVASEGGATNYQYFEQLDPESAEAAEYVEHAAEVLINEKEGEKYRPIFLSSNAITLANQIQIITRFYGQADEIHDNFDFIHCSNYWSSKTGKTTLRPDALESLLTRELRYVGSKYPVCSIIRSRKFIQRQWTINAGQYLKMVMQVNALDLTDINVLREQLTGVDAAYFCQILSMLREKQNEEGGDKINNAYLVEIIDRLF
jgi:hypothetical protein